MVLRLPASALAIVSFFPMCPAHALTRHLASAGAALSIDSPCARQVTILPDSPPGGGIAIDATADHTEELERLSLSGAKSPKLSVPDSFVRRCWQPLLSPDFKPTLEIVAHVPQGAALAIEESGWADYAIGDTGGSLNLDLSGSARMKIGRIGSFSLDLSGSADVAVSQVHGPLQAALSGSGSLHIGEADMAAASLEMSGQGGVQIERGSIGKLSADVSGAADVGIGATVSDANIELSGVGSVKIAKVTGSLQKDVSGVGSVFVGNR